MELIIETRAQWPPPDAPTARLPEVPRFDTSAFAPLLVAVGERCLTDRYGAPPLPLALGPRTALVLAATRGDVVTQAAIDDAVAGQRQVPKPLLFQNVPSTALGHLSAVWGLTGPLVATLAIGDLLAAARTTAARVLATGDADQVLAIAADPGDSPQAPGTAWAHLFTTGRT
ncbi:hypothetical protein A6A06_26940 [Streptomyces sp. CB02923]|uniref:hypothetical protein n=1 Tax=Streptomyces sp. CB02923 TaxID=1718985 RepID=UPI00093975BE|nr:hypothetical protein [Streptomyces sp. CB02923]OKH99203.1 hypothetical protein A6A06_26940 [Streptomyces sp. CB02923]